MPRIKRLKLKENIRRAREERHLSQTEAAGELGVSLRTLQEWERRDVLPHPSNRRAIFAWLKRQDRGRGPLQRPNTLPAPRAPSSCGLDTHGSEGRADALSGDA